MSTTNYVNSQTDIGSVGVSVTPKRPSRLFVILLVITLIILSFLYLDSLQNLSKMKDDLDNYEASSSKTPDNNTTSPDASPGSLRAIEEIAELKYLPTMYPGSSLIRIKELHNWNPDFPEAKRIALTYIVKDDFEKVMSWYEEEGEDGWYLSGGAGDDTSRFGGYRRNGVGYWMDIYENEITILIPLVQRSLTEKIIMDITSDNERDEEHQVIDSDGNYATGITQSYEWVAKNESDKWKIIWESQSDGYQYPPCSIDSLWNIGMYNCTLD